MTDVAARRGAGGEQLLTHWSLPAATAAALASGCAYVASHNPFTSQLTPPCLLHSVLGIYCPGCGGTRAAYDLMHGDVVGALHMNAFTTLLIIPPALFGLAWWLAASVGLNVPRFTVPRWAMWGYLAVFAAFWVLRNVGPLAPYLAP